MKRRPLLRSLSPRPLSLRSGGAFLLSGLSGLLLFASFAPLEWSEMGYVALIPFVWALRLAPAEKLRLSYAAGLLFWLPSLWFLTPVTFAGWFCLAAYCALYHLPVGWVWGKCLAAWNPEHTWRGIRLVLGGAAWWCLMEQLRGWILTGFPWNQLGTSQWENYGLIQIASLGGVTAVSFVLVTLNLGVAVSLMGLFETIGKRRPRRAHPELYIPILLLAVSFTWGTGEMRRQSAAPSRILRAAVLQPLAAMQEKWDPDLVYDNYRVLWQNSDLALNSTQPDLLVWPETALPEPFGSPQADKMLADLMRRDTPILLGALEYEDRTDAEGTTRRLYWNSSLLLTPEDGVADVYRKNHLVMFGEYIPFARTFPFLRSLTPFPEDVTPGKGDGVLHLKDPDVRMGILICFEDLMPSLARQWTAEGAELFINQTNDAWFDPYWGSRGHLANAVFRSIEQRRPTLRAANSGVSGWVDTRGVVRDIMRDPATGMVQYRGFSPFRVYIPENPVTTFYHRHPFAFPLACLGMTLLLFLGSEWGKPRFFHRRET